MAVTQAPPRAVSERDVENVADAIVDLCKHSQGVGADQFVHWHIFASRLGISLGEELKIEEDSAAKRDPRKRGEILSKRLALWMQKHETKISDAAECAYLTGSKAVAYELLRMEQEGDDQTLEALIKERFRVVGNLADLPGETLLRIVIGGMPSYGSGQRRRRRWKTVFQILGVKAKPNPCNPHNVCRELYNWNRTDDRDPRVKMRLLCDALCKVGHFGAVRELVQVPSGKKAVGRIQPSEPSPATSKEKKSQEKLSPTKHLPCVSAGTLIQVPNENKNLVGREDDVKILSQHLDKSRHVVVHGLPGIGKTSLAISLAHAVRNKYNGIAFIKCSSSSAFESSLTAICRSIDKSNVPESLSQLELLEYMKHWLTHDEKRKLLIFDGLRDVAPDVKDVSDKIEALLATESSNRPSCLFAARKEVRKIGNLRIEEVYDLKKLKEENVVDMLIERCEASRDDEEEVKAAIKIAKLVKIPHLVDLTANAIKKKGVSISTYWKYMKLKGGFRVFGDTEEDLEAKQVYKDIISENANTKALRELLVVFALTDCPELVPVDLFAIGGNKLPDCALRDEYQEEKRSCLRRDETADEANTICTMVFTRLLLELQKSHLISYDSKTGTAWMHSAISEEVLELAETESEWENCKPKRGLDILASLLTTTFEADRTDKTPAYEALVPHTFRFITNMKRRQLPISLRLQLNVGKMTSLLGRFEEAKDLLEKCKDLCGGENEDFRGKTLLHLGTAHRRLGYLPEAERLLREACEMWEQKGDSSVKLGEVKMAYAEVLMDASEFRKAYDLLKEIKEENVTDLGNYYGNMGWACYDLGKYRKAIEHFDEALEKSEHINEYRHGLFIAYQRLAKAAKFLETNKFSTRSEVMIEFDSHLQECYKAEANVRAKRGPSHRYVAFLRRAIARLYLQFSKLFPTFDSRPVSSLTDAFRQALDSLESEIKILGKQHQKVAKSCDIIAQVCSSLATRGYVISKLSKCQTLALNRAICNCEKIKCDKFPAIDKIIEDLCHRRHAALRQLGARVELQPREHYMDSEVTDWQSDSSLSNLTKLVKKAKKCLWRIKGDITVK